MYIDIDATYELVSLVMKSGIWVVSWARMTQFCLDRFDESGDILCQRYWAVLRQICAKHWDFGANFQGRFSEVRRMTSVKNGWIIKSLAPKKNCPPRWGIDFHGSAPPGLGEICHGWVMDGSLWPGVWSWPWCREDGYLHGQGACRCRCCDFSPDVQKMRRERLAKNAVWKSQRDTEKSASFVFPSDMNYGCVRLVQSIT